MNFLTTAGVDEAGRGPLAGPVVAAAVILSEESLASLENLGDSKKLSANHREILFDSICKLAVRYAIVAVGHRRIDQINIREATKRAMELCIKKVNPKLALIDGNMEVGVSCRQQTIVKGDALVPVISAASILAKVYRDRLMKSLDQKYSGYGLKIHQGYPTAAHKHAIASLGPCRIHRRTFRGVKEHLNQNFSIESDNKTSILFPEN